MTNKLTATNASLTMSGVGNINAKGIKADKLAVNAPGVGSITVEGEATTYTKSDNIIGKVNDSKLKR